MASENNHSYQRKGILSYLSNTYLNPFIEECINQKIRFEQMETSVWGNEFLVEAENISHILAFFSSRR